MANDNNNSDVAGVIGTWVAAGLALIALFGILLVYYIYRKYKTERYRALVQIDDPFHAYVSSGIPLLRWKGFFKGVSVPDLSRPPQYDKLAIVNPKRVSGNLEFSGYESLLPVSRGWLLVLGIIDRYARRVDYGLFLDEAPDLDQHLSLTDPNQLHGLSGTLTAGALSPYERATGVRQKVYFQMHKLDHTIRLQSLSQRDELPFENLLQRFLGFVPGSDGLLYSPSLSLPESSMAPLSVGAPVMDNATKFWRFVKGGGYSSLSIQSLRFLHDLGFSLSHTPLVLGHEEGPILALAPEDRSKSWYEVVQHHWVHQSHIYSLIRAVLASGPPFESFLSDTDVYGRKGVNLIRYFSFHCKLSNLLETAVGVPRWDVIPATLVSDHKLLELMRLERAQVYQRRIQPAKICSIM